MKLFVKIIIPSLIVLILAISGFLYLIEKSGPLSTETNVVIEKGVSSLEIGERLKNSGVISNAAFFRPAVLILGARGKLKAGEYKFPANISIKKVVEKMAKGDVVVHSITIPEGLTVREILEIIKNENTLSGEIKTIPKEGTLLPETYNFYYGYTREELVQRMVSEHKKLIDDLWPKRKQGLPFKSSDEAITLASIVEKETGKKEERTRVAAVYINRLNKGMLLQADPTVIYAITKGERDMGRLLLLNDLKYDSPYNTYVYAGLPPSPIASPGRASIEATLNPIESDEFYFVADAEGGHWFSRTLAEHNANVAKYRKIMREKAASPN